MRIGEPTFEAVRRELEYCELLEKQWRRQFRMKKIMAYVEELEVRGIL